MRTALLIAWLAGVAAVADTVTLKSGERIEGEVVAQTTETVTIEIANDKRTIFHTRDVSRAHVADLVVDSPARKAQRAAHDALRGYRLNANQELTPAQYATGLRAFERFLTKHPDGPLAEDVRQRLTAWQQEAEQARRGLAKFHGRWMQPAEKAAAVAEANRQAAIASNRAELAAAQLRLSRLEMDYDTLARNTAVTQHNLRSAQVMLAGLADRVTPVIEYHLTTVPWVTGRGVVGPPFLEYEPWVVDERVVPHPQRLPLERQISLYEKHVAEGERQLNTMQAEITEARERLARAEERLKALANWQAKERVW